MLGLELRVTVLRNDTPNGDENTKNGLVTNGPSGDRPPKSDDGAGLDVADDGARDGTGLGNDEELRDVDQGSEPSRLIFVLVSWGDTLTKTSPFEIK